MNRNVIRICLVTAITAALAGCANPKWGTSSSSTAPAADPDQQALIAEKQARIDSLLTAGHTTKAVRESQGLLAQLQEDPLYGWQIEGRLGLALLRDGRPAEAIPHLEAVMRRDGSLLPLALRLLRDPPDVISTAEFSARELGRMRDQARDLYERLNGGVERIIRKGATSLDQVLHTIRSVLPQAGSPRSEPP